MIVANPGLPLPFKLTEMQRLDWLRLIRSEGVGPRTFRALINRFGGAGAALTALPELGRQNGRPVTVCPLGQAEAEYQRATRMGVRFVALGESDYPRLLQNVDAPPPLIAIKGQTDVFDQPCVGIVGSRNASAAGLRIAETMAHELGRAGFTLISGLARGIDARVHWASVETGTVAVLAGGIDKPYPNDNLPLLEEIVARGGAVVSEMPMGWEPRGRDFPRRNRIISGLSYGVVVVEAAQRSGSLITARFAAEQGREVFAVPGSPLDPRAEGTNNLLRNGATLVTAAEHVVEGLSALLGRPDWEPRLREDALAETEEPLWDEYTFLDDLTDPPSAVRETENPPFGGSGEENADAGMPDIKTIGPRSEPAEGTPERPLTIQEHIIELLGPSPVSIDELIRSAGANPRTVQLVLIELEMAGRLVRHGGQLVSLS